MGIPFDAFGVNTSYSILHFIPSQNVEVSHAVGAAYGVVNTDLFDIVFISVARISLQKLELLP